MTVYNLRFIVSSGTGCRHHICDTQASRSAKAETSRGVNLGDSARYATNAGELGSGRGRCGLGASVAAA